MIDQHLCRKCGDCYQVCPLGAIRYEKAGKVLLSEKAEPVEITGEAKEKAGEIKLEDIRKEAEKKACSVQRSLRFVEEFIAGPMCGRCFPCSLGTEEAKVRLIRLSQNLGNANESDIEALKRIGFYMIEGSYCKKGRDTGRFLVEILNTSEEDFRLHLSGICPKNECVSRIEYMINPELCITCGKCLTACKYDAITGEVKGYTPFEIRQKQCVRCGECVKVCPTGAVEIITTMVEELGDEQKFPAIEGV
jgi:ferredoxin